MERNLRVLVIALCLVFVCFWTVTPVVWPHHTDLFVDFLNTISVTPNAYAFLDGTRVFVVITLAMAMTSLVQLLLHNPRKVRYWLFMVPCPWLFTYYLGQLLVETSNVYPRHGFFINNLAAGLVFAVVAVLAAQVRNIELESLGHV